METLPDVTATDADGAPLQLHDLDRPLVVYFYPKDNTPGCTREAQDFSALADEFAAAGVTLLGISRDSVAKHGKFAAKHALTVPLASDLDGSVTEAFGVWGERQMYGRTYMGIERATFLFDADGRLAREWRKVKVPGHAEAVLAAARGQ
ncbi:alkyl hydroperoxide reductase [Sphingomonas sp. Leaf412]|uniref:peroxiredoxin n=1 Tax=Sphingomonas sp. Leaf412 TaxID=1736370 RepID=UPI0006F4D05A|nr:peroxiredoxin [Sphingomonas sp. Leaf412]KQT31195.1 alkyl hydroperoxide reductase [Sphingomonas sp. Leaf412]